MNIAGDVRFVPAIHSFTEKEGVYVYSGEEVHSEEQPVVEYYTLEEARKRFDMHDTRELCESVQKMQTAEHELRMAELKVQLEESKMRAEEQKQKFEAEALERKRESDAYKEQLDKEAARRKDEYERRSVQRKDDSESWKDIWGCGQGIGAINSVVSAAERIAQLKKEYQEARKRLCS